jgi:hypothetical protein
VGKAPPAVPRGLEWDANKYDHNAAYARYWDTVLVRTPDDDPDADPRPITFGQAAAHVKLLSRRGRFWLFDAEALKAVVPALPADGREHG